MSRVDGALRGGIEDGTVANSVCERHRHLFGQTLGRGDGDRVPAVGHAGGLVDGHVSNDDLVPSVRLADDLLHDFHDVAVQLRPDTSND